MFVRLHHVCYESSAPKIVYVHFLVVVDKRMFAFFRNCHLFCCFIASVEGIKRRAEVRAMADSSARSQIRRALPAGHLLDFVTRLYLVALEGERGFERSQTLSPKYYQAQAWCVP